MAENSPVGTVVGTLMVRDEDSDGQEQHANYTFMLLDTAGGRFRLDGDTIVVSLISQSQ